MVSTRSNEVIDPHRIALGLLAHPSPSIRITAFSIFSSSTSPLSVQNLDVSQEFIPYFHAEVNPKVRNEFISMMERYCDRMGRKYSVLCKSQFPDLSMPIINTAHSGHNEQNDEDESSIARALLRSQVFFSKWYTTFLIEELQPTASYQRHITAVKILNTMFQAEIHKDTSPKLFNLASIVDDSISNREQFFGSRCIRLLQDLIMDPFDDVRLAVSSILRNILWNIPPWNLDYTASANPNTQPIISHLNVLPHRNCHTYILYVLRQAEATLSLTGRADHADGVGRLYSLLHDSCRNPKESAAWSENSWSILEHILLELEKDLEIARSDLRLAVKVAPLHGKLVALR